MPTPSKGPRLGGSPAHESLILKNLATSLFEHGRITTTQKRAKRLQPLAERLISKAKRGDLHNIRQIAKTVHNKTPRRPDEPGDANTILHRLITEIAPAATTCHALPSRRTGSPAKGARLRLPPDH